MSAFRIGTTENTENTERRAPRASVSSVVYDSGFAACGGTAWSGAAGDCVYGSRSFAFRENRDDT